MPGNPFPMPAFKYGTSQNDVLYGSGGTNDYIYGYDGDDILYGYGGLDRLEGGAGNDILDGGIGSDVMLGGDGNDSYYVDSTNDVVSDTSGIDTVYSYLSSYALGADIENGVILSSYGASLSGNGLANTLTGGSGNDVLCGGAGNDILDGGLGQDVFLFNTALDSSNIDTIQNFVAGEDIIRLDSTIFTSLTETGTLSPDAFVIGAAAQDDSDRIIFNDATGELWYDADGTGDIAAVKFATLVGVSSTLTHADFGVI